MKKWKLKPIAGVLSVQCAKRGELAKWETNLIPLGVDEDGGVMAAGLLQQPDGRAAGFVNIKGIPHTHWPQTKPTGRPTSEDKHLAVLLAWCLEFSRNGGKRGHADADVMKLFGYSDEKKVRDIRSRQARNHKVDLSADSDDMACVIDNTSNQECEAAVLIPRPTWCRVNDGFEVLGVGYAWHSGLKSRVLSGAMRVSVDELEPQLDLDEKNAKGGPVIIAVIRPGR